MACRSTRRGGIAPPYAWKGRKSRSSGVRISCVTSARPAACGTSRTPRSWKSWLLDQLQHPQDGIRAHLVQDPSGAAAFGEMLELLVEREGSRSGDEQAECDGDEDEVVLEAALA